MTGVTRSRRVFVFTASGSSTIRDKTPALTAWPVITIELLTGE
jgi:hypothetical protein